jgi:Tfp pilus assembly protein PilZ
MAEDSGATRQDQRSAPRQRWRTQVRLWNDDFEAKAFTADISNSGVLIETTRRLPIGARLHLEIKVGDRSFFSEATVARRMDYPTCAHSLFKPAIGCRFVGLVEALHSAGVHSTPGDCMDLEEPDTVTMLPEPETDETPTIEVIARIDLRDPEELRRIFESDLSKGALLVESAREVQIGQDVRVILQLPPPNGEIPLRAQVVSSFSDSREVGLVLIERRLILRRIEELLAA